MQRGLIVIGAIMIAIGLLWPWLRRMGLGRLPGDISIERDGLYLYIPITTMILVSALITLVLWFLRK